MKDLIVLTADMNMEFCMKGLLPRLANVLHCSEFSYDVRRHPGRDPGCIKESHSFLRPFSRQYHYCIVILDYHGCGKEDYNPEQLEQELESLLSKNGWLNRCCAIVIDPELENWMWVKSPHLATAMGWSNIDKLYDWLVEENFKDQDSLKPQQPKEAFEMALRIGNKPRSSAIYKAIAEKVSFKNCADRAFKKFIQQITLWFKPLE